MNRWRAGPPHEWSGAWEGRLWIVYEYETIRDVCGHLHGSPTEAERCAQEVAARRNVMLMPVGACASGRMPPDYFLG